MAGNQKQQATNRGARAVGAVLLAGSLLVGAPAGMAFGAPNDGRDFCWGGTCTLEPNLANVREFRDAARDTLRDLRGVKPRVRPAIDSARDVVKAARDGVELARDGVEVARDGVKDARQAVRDARQAVRHAR